VTEYEVYNAIGEDGFRTLIAAFYKQIPTDDILGPMYARRDLMEAEDHLRDFLVFRFGGPPRYTETRGHPRLRMRHAPFAVNQAARDRWVLLMNRALDHAALPEDATAALRDFFASMATFLVNRPD
jgi:hemoglobin